MARNETAPWSPDEMDRLRGLWEQGVSANAIAAELGPHRTRNSIISKAHRLGLAARVACIGGRPGPRPGYEREPRQEPPTETYDRSPCPRCGAAGTKGCDHRRPGQPVEGLTTHVR